MVEGSFTADTTVGILPLTVNFNLQIDSGDPVSYLWDFGDGNTSVEGAPTNIYETTGPHTVILRITDVDDNVTTIRQGYYINVGKILFEAAPSTGRSPLEVSFENMSTAPEGYVYVSWEWDFGDDSPVSTEFSPMHTYLAVGEYNVTLSAQLMQL